MSDYIPCPFCNAEILTVEGIGFKHVTTPDCFFFNITQKQNESDEDFNTRLTKAWNTRSPTIENKPT